MVSVGGESKAKYVLLGGRSWRRALGFMLD